MPMRAIALAAMALAALVAAGCNDSNSSAPQTISSFAAADIASATCASSQPVDINHRSLIDDATQTDVATLNQGCQQ